jgi:hypothetical protein
VVVAVEIQDIQPVTEAFRSDAVAVTAVNDADAKHALGTAVIEAKKSLKSIFSKRPHFAAIKQSGEDQGRVNLCLNFFREEIMIKGTFKVLNTAVADMIRL